MSSGRRSLYDEVDRLWGQGIRRIRHLEQDLSDGADPRRIIAEYRRIEHWFDQLEVLREEAKEVEAA